MPRAFSADDRDTIRRVLLEEGAARFVRGGVRKTGIEELTSAADIAKGSFYAFFASKEDLCMAIIEEREAARSQEVTALVAAEPDPVTALEVVLRYGLAVIARDPLLLALRRRGELEMVFRRVAPERRAAHLERDAEFAEALRQALRRKGAACGMAAEELAGLVRAVTTLGLHRDEIGAAAYDGVTDRLVRWVAAAAVSEDRSQGVPEGEPS